MMNCLRHWWVMKMYEKLKEKIINLRKMIFDTNEKIINLKTSDIKNDSGYISAETDPTVPFWAKQSTKPEYNYDEINNTPTGLNAFENDAGYITNEVDDLKNYYGKNEIPPSAFVSGADYGEVAEWADKNSKSEDRLHRFVTIKAGGRKIAIAKSTDQIVGITTNKTAFCGNAENYSPDDVRKTIIAIVGIAALKTHDNSIKENDRVVSDDEGYAIKSSNNLGYRVLQILENGLIEVAVSPNTDMIQRIKVDMMNKQDNLTAGTNIVIKDNVISATGGGTFDYSELDNKPCINNVQLNGNVTLEELGVKSYDDHEIRQILEQKANKTEIPTKTSQLQNDNDFVSKEYVDHFVGDIESLLSEV